MSLIKNRFPGGGASDLAVRIVGGTVQPTGVAGMIWVDTATAINKWTFAVAEPSSPATGHVWIQTDASSTNIINLLKRNTAKVNILRVKQWSGTAWAALEAHYHNGTSWTQVSNTFNPQTDLSYTGSMEYIDDGSGHWRMKFKTSGTLTVAQGTAIDAFLVGGGGGGNYGGGGGGLTTNATNYTLSAGTYSIVVGAGGNGCVTAYSTAGSNGGQTTAFGYSANGGNGAPANSVYGGNGGSAGGASGSPGQNGGSNGSSTTGATGQGTTTKEFANAANTAYGAGGGGGENNNTAAAGTGGATGGGNGGRRTTSTPTAGTTNTGGGGGGGHASSVGAAGGSGIVIIRDHRAA